MQAPPSYTTPPRKGLSPWLLVGLGGVGCCLCGFPVLAALIFPIFAQSNEAAKRTACLSNVKQSATAALIYASDWDDRLPTSSGWMDAVIPYTKKPVLQCPLVRDGHGFAMNDTVSLKKIEKIVDPNKVVMVFETDDLAYNAHGKPPSPTMPGPRHGSRSVAFVDGSAKSIKNSGR